MKLTKTQLREIIKEEMESLNEKSNMDLIHDEGKLAKAEMDIDMVINNLSFTTKDRILFSAFDKVLARITMLRKQIKKQL